MTEIIQYLQEKKVINKNIAQKVRKKVEETGKSPEEVFLEQQILPEKKLFQLKSELLKIPLKEISPDTLSPQVFSLLPKESIEFYKMAPLNIDLKEKTLEVGMIYPENIQAQEALNFFARQQQLKPKVFLITFSDFKKYLNKYRAPEKEMERALERLEQELKSKQEKTEIEIPEASRLTEEAPIIRMVAIILRQAVERGASDIHIEPTRESLRVRYRLDGILYPTLFLPLRIHPAIVTRIKILSRLKIDETRMPQDGRFSTKIEEKKIDFRVSTFPTNLGEKVVMRVLDPEEGLKPLNELGLSERNFEVVNSAIKKPIGLILATGPTGSGKTTTLYALLRILNKEAVNIVTLEDPIEYFIPGVNQSQVRPEINYTFARGLRQILRQDPDIIMVGEIRDEETAALAVHAALTGHLVLSTLHTNNAPGVIPRLIDMGIKPFLLPPTLSLAISQRLVRVLCPFCKEKVKLEGEPKRYLLQKIKNLPPYERKKINIKEPIYVYKPKGCKKCNLKGYKGRIGVFEILKMTDSLAEIITKTPSEKEITKEARRQGMISMEEDGLLKVLQGITSFEEVMRVTQEL